MPKKLHLKRTPEEERLREIRKEAKRAARRKRRELDADLGEGEAEGSTSRKRRRANKASPSASPRRKWASSDEDDVYGPKEADQSQHGIDEEIMMAEARERRFQEKMFEALADDERLDGIEARLNDFGHVPGRWKDDPDPFKGKGKDDPRYMDEEEYAEWVRAGMYRKTHAAEYEEAKRQKEAAELRRAERKARASLTKELEKAAAEERRRKEEAREIRRAERAREEYEKRWKILLGGNADSLGPMRFGQVPWPIMMSPIEKVEDLSEEGMVNFLFGDKVGIEKKEKQRETILRFHPDKFEGRIMKLVDERDREMVKEGIGRVVRLVNSMS